jgi:hypothetical protein
MPAHRRAVTASRHWSGGSRADGAPSAAVSLRTCGARPDQRVCRRHRRWLGGLTDSNPHQHDLAPLPEVVGAQRHHYRLLRRHGIDTTRTAIHSATTIVDGWTERGEWSERRERRLACLPVNPVGRSPGGSGVLRLVNYPEVVTLASLLASEQWRAAASADHRRDRVSFDREVARRLGLAHTGFDAGDPLVRWQDGQALIRRQRLHQQPGYRGPEIWLSQAGELHYEPTDTPKSNTSNWIDVLSPSAH